MAERKYLGQIDKTRDYVAVCQLTDEGRPDEYEIWFNPDMVHIAPYAFHKMRNRIKEQSEGRWQLRSENVNVGRFIVREDRNRPKNDAYDSDRAIADVLAFILEAEKPEKTQQWIAEQRISAQVLKTAKKNKSAAR